MVGEGKYVKVNGGSCSSQAFCDPDAGPTQRYRIRQVFVFALLGTKSQKDKVVPAAAQTLNSQLLRMKR
jgi:hypothetical protein